jgi:PAS domain-containing protein
MEALRKLKEVDAKLTLYFEQLTWNDYLEEFFLHLPWPAWIKSPDGEMLAMNPAYTSRYGVENYEGSRDAPWPDEIRRKFSENDRDVARSGLPSTFIERLTNPKTGTVENVTVIKFPVYSGPDLVGVGGFSVYIPT